MRTYYNYNGFREEEPRQAVAYLTGGPLAPMLKGQVVFQQLDIGVNVSVYVEGMPITLSDGKASSFHGFHIHEVGDCTVGDEKNPFKATGGHYNPGNTMHPYHAGDMPPLLANNGSKYGTAMMSFVTNRFKVKDIIGKSVIIHEGIDDFTSQPAGNAGAKWACGVIKVG